MSYRISRRQGFTLIELLLVVVIIGIIAALVLAKIRDTRERAYVAAMMNDVRNFALAQEQYFSANAEYGSDADLQAADLFHLSHDVATDSIDHSRSDGFFYRVRHAKTNIKCLIDYGRTADGMRENRVVCEPRGSAGAGPGDENGGGDEDDNEDEENNTPPVASLMVHTASYLDAGAPPPYQARPGDVVALDATMSSDPDGEIVLYEFVIAGGAPITRADPILLQTFETEGTFPVAVRVQDDHGDWSAPVTRQVEITEDLTIEPGLGPMCDAPGCHRVAEGAFCPAGGTAPLAVMVPSVPNPTSPIITFDASASSGAITSYEWEFSAPGFSATDNGVVVNVNVPFDVLGTMYVTITTRNAEGCVGWARYEMEMDEFRPQEDEDEGEVVAQMTMSAPFGPTGTMAVFTDGPLSPPFGIPVTLSAAGTEGATSYYWYINGVLQGTGETATVTFSSQAATEIRLVASNSSSTDMVTQVVTPHRSLLFNTSTGVETPNLELWTRHPITRVVDPQPLTDHEIIIDACASLNDWDWDYDPYFRFDLGNGTVVEGAGYGCQVFGEQYSEPGEYVVTAEVFHAIWGEGSFYDESVDEFLDFVPGEGTRVQGNVMVFANGSPPPTEITEVDVTWSYLTEIWEYDNKDNLTVSTSPTFALTGDAICPGRAFTYSGPGKECLNQSIVVDGEGWNVTLYTLVNGSWTSVSGNGLKSIVGGNTRVRLATLLACNGPPEEEEQAYLIVSRARIEETSIVLERARVIAGDLMSCS